MIKYTEDAEIEIKQIMEVSFQSQLVFNITDLKFKKFALEKLIQTVSKESISIEEVAKRIS